MKSCLKTFAWMALVTMSVSVLNNVTAQVPQPPTPGVITPPPQEFFISPGGVDMRTGRYAFGEMELSIGDKAGGIEFNRILSTALLGHIDPFGNFSHNWDITLLETRVHIRRNILKHGSGSGPDYRFTVNYDGRSDTFQNYGRYATDPNLSQGGWQRISSGPHSALTSVGDRTSNNVVYTYHLSGGTMVVFRPLARDCTSSTARCAYPSQVIRADGTIFSFEYDTTGAPNGTRLRSVTNNRGYALLLEYSGAWNLVTKACVLNLADTAKPSNNSCPAGAVSTSYTYTTYDGMTLLQSATNAAGHTATYGYGANPAGSTSGVPDDRTSGTKEYSMSYTKAGQTTPWHVANIKVRFDGDSVPDHIVGRQSFSDGSAYTYRFGETPEALQTPSIAGGNYVDALNNATHVIYDFPQLPLLFAPGFEDCWGQDPCPYNQDDPLFMQVPPGPTEVIDALGRSTLMNYCNRIDYETVPGACIVTDLQSYSNPESDSTHYWYRAGHREKSRRVAKTGMTDPAIEEVLDISCANMATCGKPLHRTDPRGNVTDYEYNLSHGGLLSVTEPAVPVPPSPGATPVLVRPKKVYAYEQRYAWYKNSAGTLIQASGPVWVMTRISECRTSASCVGTADETVTTIGYGAAGTPNNLLPRSVTVAAGNGSISATTTMSYDGQGNLIITDGSLPGAADTTRMRYDALRRLVGTVTSDPDGSGPLPYRAVRNTYSPAGDLEKVESGTVSGQSDAEWPLFAPHIVSYIQNDALGRKVRESLSVGGVTKSVTQYKYDLAQRLECTAVRMDPSQWNSQTNACVPQTGGPFGPDRVTKNFYNAAGERIRVQIAVGTADQADEEVRTYTGNGKVRTLTDGEGNVSTFEYDGHDRLFKTRYPDKITKGLSSTTDYEQFLYDLSGNREQHRLRDGQVIVFQNDALNRMVLKDLPGSEPNVSFQFDLQGHPTGLLQGTAAVYRGWDALGRVRSETTFQGTMIYGYDEAGRRNQTTWPDGFYVQQDFLTTGEVRAIREYGAASGVGVLATYGYDSLGRRVSITRGNGAVSRFSYDASRLTSLAHDIADTASDVASTFKYNPASQLVTWTRNNPAYAWRGHFNQNRSYSINGLNQISTTGGVTFQYDLRGNLTNQGLGTYTYSAENRLLSASNGSSFNYDPLGRLYQSSSSAGTTRFQYDNTDLVAEYNASNQLARRYVHGPGEDEPVVWYEGSGTGDRRWLHHDERGSVVAVTGAAGSAIAINSYDEYGVPAAGNQGRFQYTGQTWMPEVGMYYYKARVYAPRLGRFLQPDPIGYEDDFSLYAYVKNDPVNKTDPTGQCESISTCQMQREERAVLAGEMSPEQYQENNAYRAASAGAGLAILATRGLAVPAIAKAFRSWRFERRMEKTREKLEGWKETPNRKGEGSRFENPDNKGDRVRVDKGDPDHQLPSQRVDHVRVDRDGKVIGRNGKPIQQTPEQPKPSKTEDAHIPWRDWFKNF